MASPSTLLRQRYVYLALRVVGLFLPYWQFVSWFLNHGLDIRLFVQHLFANASEPFLALMSLFRHWCSGSSFLQREAASVCGDFGSPLSALSCELWIPNQKCSCSRNHLSALCKSARFTS